MISKAKVRILHLTCSTLIRSDFEAELQLSPWCVEVELFWTHQWAKTIILNARSVEVHTYVYLLSWLWLRYDNSTEKKEINCLIPAVKLWLHKYK